jgi:hypothetical protein
MMSSSPVWRLRNSKRLASRNGWHSLETADMECIAFALVVIVFLLGLVGTFRKDKDPH